MKVHGWFICRRMARGIAEDIANKAKNIKALLFDVDGVLTDGGIIYDNNGQEYKRFNVKDGQIIKHLRRYKILTGVITGRDSPVVRNRCEELGIDLHHHGIHDKLSTFTEILETHNLKPEEVAYVGDDINDLPVLTKCGLSATPADGHEAVRERVAYVLDSKGGEGALRELADTILKARGFYDEIISSLTT